MKATELLQKQHRDIEQLLERVKTAGDDRTVREDLARILVAHTGIEEEIFYPAMQKVAPELTLEAIEEHGLADYELGRALAQKTDGDARLAKLDVLAEVVLLHIRREENDLFRTAERALGHEELVSLGAEMEPRFRELSASGYVKLLDRAITRNTPHLVAARATRATRAARAAAKKTTRRAAAPKKTTPKAKRGTTTQRGAAGTRKGRKTTRARTARTGTARTG